MRSVTLGHTGIVTSALGYGCAGLMRPPTPSERAALLETAHEVGVRHFDTARYYGYGGSERVLGGFIRAAGRRDEFTVTTKFGIEPPAVGGGSSRRGAWIMGLARRVANLHPAVRRVMSRTASRGVRAGRFDVESAQCSLETSLRELATDYVDLFLLHEGMLADTRSEGLREFLENAVRQGKIRAFGVGSDFVNIPGLVTGAPEFARAVQFANSLNRPDLARLASDPDRAVLTHGALKVLPALAAAASQPQNRDALDRWLDDAGLPRDTPLARLLLGHAQWSNPGGVVLFSSVTPARIRDNAAGLDPVPGDASWRAFASLLTPWLSPANGDAARP